MSADEFCEFTLPPILSCPHCASGSDELATAAQGKSEWAELECPSCHHPFQIAHAIDAMFLRGDPQGYALWANRTSAHYQVTCHPGQSVLIPIRDRFSDVYRIMWGTFSGISVLAGGISTKYVQQGYVLVAVASNQSRGHGDRESPLELVITVIGESTTDPPLEPWKALIMEARLGSLSSNRLAPIAVVAALDVFLEGMTRKKFGGGRPDCWDSAVRRLTGTRLRTLLGKDYADLKSTVDARNELAHGGDYLAKLPADVAVRESRWLECGRYYEGEAAISPVSSLSLCVALATVRKVRATVAGKP